MRIFFYRDLIYKTSFFVHNEKKNVTYTQFIDNDVKQWLTITKCIYQSSVKLTTTNLTSKQ